MKRLSAFPAPTPPSSLILAHPAHSPEWGCQEVCAGGPGNTESRQEVSLALASTQLVLPPKIILVTGLLVERWNQGDMSRRKIAGYSKADQRKEKGGEIWKENGISPAFHSGPRSKHFSALSLEVRGRSHPCSQLLPEEPFLLKWTDLGCLSERSECLTLLAHHPRCNTPAEQNNRLTVGQRQKWKHIMPCTDFPKALHCLIKKTNLCDDAMHVSEETQI